MVKAFGAEAREDARLGRVLDKWRRRTDRIWVRGTYNGTAQMTALLVLRAGDRRHRRCGSGGRAARRPAT